MTELKKMETKKYEVFLEGEVIDLCVPSGEAWIIDQWYKWFNDQTVTKYLAQGVYPNTPEIQREYFEELSKRKDRIALLIKPKKKDYLVGVASLSFIDFQQRQCDFAMVIGKQDGSADSLFYALEAKCLITEHAFENLGMERVSSSQVVDLIKWQRWQILFGYHIEGIQRKKYRKGHKIWDVMISSCLIEDYFVLKDIRNGSLWPGRTVLFDLLKEIPSETTIDRLQDWLDKERESNLEFVK